MPSSPISSQYTTTLSVESEPTNILETMTEILSSEKKCSQTQGSNDILHLNIENWDEFLSQVEHMIYARVIKTESDNNSEKNENLNIKEEVEESDDGENEELESEINNIFNSIDTSSSPSNSSINKTKKKKINDEIIKIVDEESNHLLHQSHEDLHSLEEKERQREDEEKKIEDLDVQFFENLQEISHTDISLSCLFHHKIWKNLSNLRDIFPKDSNERNRRYIHSINGILIGDLDRDLQIALIKQKSRPLIIEIKSLVDTENDSSNSLKSSTDSSINSFSNSSNFSYADFLQLYEHSHCLKLRKQVDKYIQDFIKCDWNHHLRNSTSSSTPSVTPQMSVISIYKFIEQELFSLEIIKKKKEEDHEDISSNMNYFPSDIEGKHESKNALSLLSSGSSSSLTSLTSSFISPPTNTTCYFMEEKDIISLREHIEVFVFSKLYTYIKGINPPKDESLDLIEWYSEFLVWKKKLLLKKNKDNELDEDDDEESIEITNKEREENQKNFFLLTKDLDIYEFKSFLNHSNPHSPHNSTTLSDKKLFNCSPYQSLELHPFMPLNIKISFLRFLSLSNLGLDLGDDLSSIHSTSTFSSAPLASISSSIKDLESIFRLKYSLRMLIMKRNLLKEEWYLASKGIRKACQADSPSEILKRFVRVMRLIINSLRKILNQSMRRSSILEKELFQANTMEDLDLIMKDFFLYHQLEEDCSCSTCSHLIHLIDPSQGQQEVKLEDDYLNDNSPILTFPYHIINHPSNNIRYLLQVEKSSSSTSIQCSCSLKSKQQTQKSISADDLLPGFVYTLINSNPQDLEAAAHIASEYKNSNIFLGEESYALTQVHSALEFLKQARLKDFSISTNIEDEERFYTKSLYQYHLSLKLLIACKVNNLHEVKQLIFQGADPNAYCPDNKETPLSACIRYNSYRCFAHLMKHQKKYIIVVDQPINLFASLYERSTAFLLSVQQNQPILGMILLLSGANPLLTTSTQESVSSIIKSQNLLKDRYFWNKIILNFSCFNHSSSNSFLDSLLSIKRESFASWLIYHKLFHLILPHHPEPFLPWFNHHDAQLFSSNHNYPPMAIHKEDSFHSKSLNIRLNIPEGMICSCCSSTSNPVCSCSFLPVHFSSFKGILTPLISAILSLKIDNLRMILSSSLRLGNEYLDLDYENEYGHTALDISVQLALYYIQKNLDQPSEQNLKLIDIFTRQIAILLRCGAKPFKVATEVFGIVVAYSQNPQNTTLHKLKQTSAPVGFNQKKPLPELKIESENKNINSDEILKVYIQVGNYFSLCTDTSSSTSSSTSTSISTMSPTSPKIIDEKLNADYSSRYKHSDQLTRPWFLVNPYKFIKALITYAVNNSNEPGSVHSPKSSTANSSLYEYAYNKDFASLYAALVLGKDINSKCPRLGKSLAEFSLEMKDSNLLCLIIESHKLSSMSFVIDHPFYYFFKEIDSKLDDIFKSSQDTSLCPSFLIYPRFPITITHFNPNIPCRNEAPPLLHQAIRSSMPGLLGLLLFSGAQREIKDIQGRTPKVLIEQKIQQFQQLFNQQISQANNSPSHYQANLKQLEDQLAKYNTLLGIITLDPTKDCICHAARQGDLMSILALLSQGVSPNSAPLQITTPNAKGFTLFKENTTSSPVKDQGQKFALASPLIASIAFGQKKIFTLFLELENIPALPSYPVLNFIKKENSDYQNLSFHDTTLTELIPFGSPILNSLPALYFSPRVSLTITNPLGQNAFAFASARYDEELIMKLFKYGFNHGLSRDCLLHPDVNGHLPSYWAKQQEEQLRKEIKMIQGQLVQIQHLNLQIQQQQVKILNGQIAEINLKIKKAVAVHALLTYDASKEYVHDYIRKGNLVAVKALLKQNPDPNLSRYHLTPIHATKSTDITLSDTSISFSNKSSKSLSLSPSSSLSTISTNSSPSKKRPAYILGETPLIVAARYNQVEILKLLLTAPEIQVNKTDALGRSALFHAVQASHEDTVLLLLKAKADRYMKDIFSNSIYLYALSKYHGPTSSEAASVYPIASVMYGAQRTIYNSYEFFNDLISSDSKSSKYLKAEHKWTKEQEFYYKLLVSKQYDDLSLIDYYNRLILIKSPSIASLIEADPYKVFLHQCCENNRLDLIIALFKQGCPVNYRDERPGKYHETVLMTASTHKRVEIVKFLLKAPDLQPTSKGNPLDLRDDIGRTALMRAAAVGCLEITGLLLSAGASRDLKDAKGLAAVDHAGNFSLTTRMQFMAQKMIR